MLLSELLVGRPPFDTPASPSGSGPASLLRLIQERQTRAPSTLLSGLDRESLAAIAARRQATPRRLLGAFREDLDWIVLRAAAAEPRLRYETANALAMDVLRCLAHEAVLAHPEDQFYRLRKLVRRHHRVFLTASVVAVALAAGFSTSTWLFLRERQARREQVLLRQEADQARAIETGLRQRAEIREKISQAAVLLLHGDPAGADRLVAAPPIPFVPPSLECSNVMHALGTWHALAGRWDLAAARFEAQGFAIAHSDGADSDDVSRDFVPIGASICEAGDEEHYRDFREMTLERFGRTRNPIVAEQILKTCLLHPADAPLLDHLAPLAEVVSATLSSEGFAADRDPYMSAWRALSLALFEYRRGSYAAASTWAERCLAYSDTNPARRAAAFVVLALSLQSQGRTDDARHALDECRILFRSIPGGNLAPGGAREGFWSDWVNVRILLREADGRPGPRPPTAR